MKKKRVFIVGLAGHNLGDDAIAFTAWSTFKGDCDVKVSTVNKGRLQKYGISEVYLNRKSPLSMLKVAKAMLWADVLLVGGGSLIQDKLGYGYFKGVLGFTNQVTLLAKICNLKVASLPIGIDRLHSEQSRALASKVLSRFSVLTVRDDVSKKLGSEYSSTSIESNIMADPAFNIDDFILINKVDDHPYMVISLVRENLDLDKFVAAISAYIRYLLKKTDLNIKLLCMDTRKGDEYQIYLALMDNVVDERIDIIVDDDLNSVCNLIWNADHIIAMRLHTMIIGLGYTPMFCISRTTKTDTLCRQSEIPYIDMTSEINEECMIEFFSSVVAGKSALLDQSRAKRTLLKKIRLIDCL